MNTPQYVTCRCQHCNGGIEFDSNELAETNSIVPCPHCGLETKLVINPPGLVSSSDDKPLMGVAASGGQTASIATGESPSAVPQNVKPQKRTGSHLARLTDVSIRARTKTGDTPLHRAAKTGRISEIPRHLLQTELFLIKNYDAQNKHHRTPLHIAAMYGHFDKIPFEFLTTETLAALDIYGKTPLHEAAASGHADKIPEELLTPEFLSLPEALYGNSIMHYFAWRNDLSSLPGKCITRDLLNLENHNGETPQQIVEHLSNHVAWLATARGEPATEKQKEKLRLFDYTWREGMTKGQASDALERCARNFPAIYQNYYNRFVAEAPMVSLRSNDSQKLDGTNKPTMLAAVAPSPNKRPDEQKRVRTVLATLNEETIRTKTQSGDTPLHRAARTGRISEIPRHLLKVELFMVTNYSFHPETPLHVAARYGMLSEVPPEFLTKQTLTASTEYVNKESLTGPTPPLTMTPLHTAALHGHADQIPKEFLTPEFLCIEATGYRQTVLHYFALSKSLHLIPQIYSNSEMWNLKDSHGQTPRRVLEGLIQSEAYVSGVRNEPATEKQKEKLRWFGFNFDEGITKGQAHDAIDECIQRFPTKEFEYYNRPATEEQLTKLPPRQKPLTYGQAKDLIQERELKIRARSERKFDERMERLEARLRRD